MPAFLILTFKKVRWKSFHARNMKIKDKVVLITGSSSGIGKSTSIAFARKSAKLVLTYNKTKEGGEETLKECKKYSEALLVQLDVKDDNSINNLVKEIINHFRKIDIVINNSGIVVIKDFDKQTFEDIENHINVNLTGAMKVTHAFLPYLKKQDEALIINIASAYSKVVDSEVVPYCASKFGLRGFTQALALELPKNVRTYVVNPGLTATRMTNFSGVAVEKVADIIVKTAEETLNKKSGDDIDLKDYVK